jgi:aminopeptidase N
VACPATYAAPDPARPAVTLRFTIGADHRTVVGHEQVVFRPDLPTDQMVFRLWPNGRDHLLGGSLTVAQASVDGRRVALRLASAGGRKGTQGTLLTLPIGKRVAAGATVTAELDFMLTLPPATLDRIGSDGHSAWWGTGFPLLSWVRGQGWSRTPGSSTPAEMAVSEAARIDVTVIAPTADAVVANGTADPPTPVSATARSWHFANPVARDVAVAVGPLRIETAAIPVAGGSVPVRIATAKGIQSSATELLNDLRRAMPLAVKHFGPFPFAGLTVAVLPGLTGTGIEYPGMYLVGDGTGQSIITHELMHMWFYGLVGDDQELHPWLDEAFATFAEQLIDAEIFGADLHVSDTIVPPDPRPVDSPVTAFEHDYSGYNQVVYFKGASALLIARQRAGPAAFDSALRCYLRVNAWRVAAPSDLSAALHGLPAAISALREAGALR